VETQQTDIERQQTNTKRKKMADKKMSGVQGEQLKKLHEERDRLQREWMLLSKSEPPNAASGKIIEFVGKRKEPILEANEWNTDPPGPCCTIM